jgi:hypothetical protein
VHQYGTAIEPENAPLAVTSLGCFAGVPDGKCAASSLASESRDSNHERTEGFSYRNEVPFAIDNGFNYVDRDNDNNNIEDYCNKELGYSTCNYWTRDRWYDWNANLTENYISNAKSFLNGSTAGLATITENTITGNSQNSVINAMASSGEVVGNSSFVDQNSNTRVTLNRAFIDGTALTPQLVADSRMQSRAWGTDGAYVVGSSSTHVFATDYSGCTELDNSQRCQNAQFASKATIWTAAGAFVEELPWGSGVTNEFNNISAQASARGIFISGTNVYLPGFNTYVDSDNRLMEATVFIGDTNDPSTSAWTSKRIENARVSNGSDYIHSNSVANDINKNLLVIGSAKRAGHFRINGTANNRLFVADASQSTISASFLSGGIFFSNAGGEMGGVNNFNEIVGQIDVENNREFDGKQRRKRGFIYPYNTTGTDPTRRAIFQNKSWILDDLTNGGASSIANNKFRIYNATDINDGGVISATAFYCSVGYDSTAHDAYCGGGSVNEQIVAVKLVPKSDANSGDISARGYVNRTVERQGAGIGMFGLGLLAFLGFRRKFH